MANTASDSKYEIQKRRYLNRACIAFNDKYILANLVKSLSQQEEYNKQTFSLRKTISKLFFLTENLTFRQNATQAFRDVLEGIIYHLKAQINFADCKLLVSDIDHPVMTQMASVTMSSKYIYKAKLIEKAILNVFNSNDEISEIYLNEIHLRKIKIVLIPHVNWINGAKFDVHSICHRIKKYDDSIITIVDGAQALANAEAIIDTSKFNQDIDFYIGSGHKWMGSPMPIGFVRVGDRYMKRKPFRDYLFISDYFSKFAGNLKYINKLAQDTYNIPLSILFNSILRKFQESNNEMHQYYYSNVIDNLEPIRTILNSHKSLIILDTNPKMRTGIITITGDIIKLNIIHQALMDNYFNSTKGQFDYNGKNIPFIRISSPVNSLETNDLELFNNCFK